MLDTHSYSTMQAEDSAPRRPAANAPFRRAVYGFTGRAKLPMLSREQERELINLAQSANDEEAISTLVEHHQGFLINCAKRFAAGADMLDRMDDFYNEACGGFIKAIQNHRPDRNDARLATFARFAVTGACLTFIREMKHPFRVGTNLPEKKAYFALTKIRKAFEDIHRRPMQNNEADIALAAELSDIPVATLRRVLEIRSGGAPFCPHEIQIHDHHSSFAAENKVARSSGQACVDRHIQRVADLMIARDRDIVMAMLSDPEGRQEQMAEMSAKHGISIERIRQIYRGAIADIRKSLAADGITSFSDVA